MTVTFLEDKGRLPDGTRWRRRSHEPWFLDVFPGTNIAWQECIKDVAGVGVDGYRKSWVVPEEVFVLYVMKGDKG